MTYTVLKYLVEKNRQPNNTQKEPGPVVTISRQMGCPGTGLPTCWSLQVLTSATA